VSHLGGRQASSNPVGGGASRRAESADPPQFGEGVAASLSSCPQAAEEESAEEGTGPCPRGARVTSLSLDGVHGTTM